MSWIPSADDLIARVHSTPLWGAIEDIFDRAVPLEPLSHMSWKDLQKHYVLERSTADAQDLDAMKSKLPRALASLPLGAIEVEVISFLVNYDRDRVLALDGPRGSGKSSLLHYVQRAISSTNYESPPVLITFDGLQLIKDHGERLAVSLEQEVYKSFDTDCASIMDAALSSKADLRDEAMRQGIERACNRLGREHNLIGVREAFRDLSAVLTERQRRRIVVVFDNLDQLPTICIRGALGLARAIYSAARIGSLICLRPNCLRGAAQRGDARHFLRYRASVSGPSAAAWVKRLGGRMAEAASSLSAEGASKLTVFDRPITPADIGIAMDRFGDLLVSASARSVQSDIVAVLQAVAADDTRHLRVLVRRILSNRRLPVHYLLGRSGSHDFQPLEALFEGSLTCFRHNNFVPNLMFFRHDGGQADYLLCHRILTLLSLSETVEVAELINCLALLDYPSDVVRACLHLLHGPLLIRATDTDMFDPSNPPTALYLTNAGKYYRNHLLKTADYLATAVLDVPLEHRGIRDMLDRDKEALQSALSTTGAPFWLRIESLIEYAEEIANREGRQIRLLTRARPSERLRRMADLFQKGGLLTYDLHYALRNVIERGRSSASVGLRRNLDAIENRTIALANSLQNLEELLREIANRGRKAPRTSPPPDYTQQFGPLGISATEIGDSITTFASAVLSDPTSVAVFALRARVDGVDVTRCSLAPQPQRDASENDVACEAIATFADIPSRGGGP